MSSATTFLCSANNSTSASRPPRLSPTKTFPPRQTTSSPNHSPPSSQRLLLQRRTSNLSLPQTAIAVQRRDFALLLSLGTLILPSLPAPAAAINLGISGPKDWLREQKKKAAKYLLAPIDASREILRSAYLKISKDSDYQSKDLEEVRNMVRTAARDCVPAERNSFVSFQAKTGVEVCTFKLVVKNASSLLDDKDPVKLEAEAMLSDLIRSFTFLSDATNEADIQQPSNRQKVGNALTEVISSLDKFEEGVKDCLEV